MKGILASAPASSPLTPFQELIEEWLDYCKAGGLAPKTLLDYRKFVSRFYWWWADYSHKDEGKEPHPADVTTRHVREFAAYLRTTKVTIYICSNLSRNEIAAYKQIILCTPPAVINAVLSDKIE